MRELLMGITLLIVSAGSLTACLPRNGKKAWFVGIPFLDAGVPVLILSVFAIGVVLVVAYFTTIDDMTLSGKLL